jgi:parallel beta-helix repeat protein
VPQNSGRRLRAVASALSVPALVGALLLSPGAAAAAPATLYVSAANGSDGNTCSQSAPCATIGYALSQANPGDTVVVQPGTYKEQVTITQQVTLEGYGLPEIDATGQGNGVVVRGAAAAGSTVEGFNVQNATFEGILVESTSGVTVSDNVVENNDQGATAQKPVGECAPQGQIPGDCGEGIHLMGVTDSTVESNLVTANQGGILLSDETGPTARNLIEGNTTIANLYDCGITLASHNPKAAPKGVPDPSAGGVYDNQVVGNVSAYNGIAGGGGSGVLIAGGPPGTAGYDNLVEDNNLFGNGHAGVTLHSHAPLQDFNGNRIIDNTIGQNAVDGGAKGAPGDDDAGVTQTAGIVVFSQVTPLSGTLIAGNRISDDGYGVWTQNVPASAVRGNYFSSDVATPISQN